MLQEAMAEFEKRQQVAETEKARAGVKKLFVHALLDGRGYATEDDFKAVAFHALHHRLVFTNKKAGEEALAALVDGEVEKLRSKAT